MTAPALSACSDCDGTGWHFDEDQACYYDDRPNECGTIACDACEGSGKVAATCGFCEGPLVGAYCAECDAPLSRVLVTVPSLAACRIGTQL